MGKIIAIANQKGGVGKTTTALNVCCSLKRAGKRVLLVDSDPQGNATTGMGVDKDNVTPTMYELLIDGTAPGSTIVATRFGDVIPANKALYGAGIQLIDREKREYILKNALEALRDRYDYILIDCPPSLEMLTLNALCAADTVLIPVQCEYFALEGLTALMTTMRMTKRGLNPTLEIEGVVLTMYDGRTNLSLQVVEEVKKYFKEKVYRTVVPRNVRLGEAPSHGKPAVVYDGSSRGSKAYVELTKEILERNKEVAHV